MQRVVSKAIVLIAFAVLGWVVSQEILGFTDEITLSHGGKIKGLQILSYQTPVDLFLGIRYAKPPVGDLRFKRAEEYPPWDGVKDATEIGDACPQIDILGDITGRIWGEEDCLFMDVYVPGGVSQAKNKTVMVWIHGGGYYLGSGLGHPGGPLSAIGDVIVVTFNYRLGPLGFLADGAGTGNFGLWDQRAALLWVKKNIASFGGNPDLVTIFGQSAGGASVSALTVSPQTDGLFQRAIMQSGAALIYWSIMRSENDYYKLNQRIRDDNSCDPKQSVYDCLRHASLDTVFKYLDENNYMFHLYPDGEFLPQDIIETQDYNLSQRFDLMAGMTGQEGIILFAFDVRQFVQDFNKTSTDGITLDETKGYLLKKCHDWITRLSAELCADFLLKTYKMDEAGIDDKERTKRLVSAFGEHHFNVDIVNNIEQQSTSSDRSTYAYYFTEPYKPAEPLWPAPNWLKYSANHGDDLPFVFGSPYINEDGASSDLWSNMTKLDSLVGKFLHSSGETEKNLSNILITMWSNFAKSGNPNEPVQLPSHIPEWPQFNTETMQFMELNSAEFKIVTTPNKERLDKVRNDLFSARIQQILSDAAPVFEECQDEEISDEVKDSASNSDRNNSSAKLSVNMTLLSLCVLFYSKFGL